MLSVFLGLITAYHAIYISVVEITFNSNQHVEVVIKVFTDDLEDAIRNHSERISLKDCTSGKSVILEYLSETFQLSTSGRNLELGWRTCENTNDSVWIYLSGTGDDSDVHVKASYFFELFPTQTQVVSVTKGDRKQFLKLTKGNQEGTVTFR